MHSQLFVNLPVQSLARSRAFFEQMGYSFDPRFSNDQAGGLILGENLFAMLLEQPMFQGFSGRALIDPKANAQVMVALACASRDEVDELVAKAIAAGGSAPRPAQDHGFMYAHGFDDPDGHIWEVFYMDPSAHA